MNKLMMMFMLLFVSSGLAFANQAKFDSAEVKVVYEEEEEHEDEDEDHEDDDHEDDDDHEEFNEEEFKAFLKEHFGFAKQLWEAADEDDREDFIEEMEELYLEYIEHQQEPGAELMLKVEIMEVQSHLIGEMIRQAKSSEEKQQMSQKLAQHLNQLFDLKLRAYHREVEEMKQEIQEMQKMIEKRKRLKEKIIEMQMLKLTNEEELLEW